MTPRVSWQVCVCGLVLLSLSLAVGAQDAAVDPDVPPPPPEQPAARGGAVNQNQRNQAQQAQQRQNQQAQQNQQRQAQQAQQAQQRQQNQTRVQTVTVTAADQRLQQQLVQQEVTQLRQTLRLTGEEWLVLEPRITALVQARAEAQGSTTATALLDQIVGRLNNANLANALGQLTDRVNTAIATQDPNANAISRKTAELRVLLASPAATAEQIDEKLVSLRQTRDEAAENLKTAQNKLRMMLTVEQEAMLVVMGYLE